MSDDNDFSMFPETTQKQRAWAVAQACKTNADDPMFLARKILWYVMALENAEPEA